MHLRSLQAGAIKQETELFCGAKTALWQFGARADGTPKGGDMVQIFSSWPDKQGVSL